MLNATRMMLVLFGLLPGTVVLADNVTTRDWSRVLRTTVTSAVPVPGSDAVSPTPRTFSRFDELDFQDSSTVGRASKIRSLSLLTLAESRKLRLFFGVNNRGLLGLHLRSVRQGDDRCLEIARLPYLRQTTPE